MLHNPFVTKQQCSILHPAQYCSTTRCHFPVLKNLHACSAGEHDIQKSSRPFQQVQIQHHTIYHSAITSENLRAGWNVALSTEHIRRFNFSRTAQRWNLPIQELQRIKPLPQSILLLKETSARPLYSYEEPTWTIIKSVTAIHDVTNQHTMWSMQKQLTTKPTSSDQLRWQ